MILPALAVVPQPPDFLLQLCIVSYHGTGLTKRAEILPRIEAETAGIAKDSHLISFVFGSVPS
jgi:hypothetical protein